MSHLDICNSNFERKKGRESNWPRRGTTFVETSLESEVEARRYELPKSQESNLETDSGLLLGSPRKKNHLDVASVKKHRIYYMGEGGGFPRVRAVVSQVNPRLPVACPNTKRM
jgi:hypothetical protein